MADIFFEGKIYPNADMEGFLPMGDIQQHLSILTSYPVQSPHPFTDGQNVTGLYELHEDSPLFVTSDDKCHRPRQFYAIPTPPSKVVPVEVKKDCNTCKNCDLDMLQEPCFSCCEDLKEEFKNWQPVEPVEVEGMEKEAEQIIESFYQIVHDIVDVNNGFWYAKQLASKHCDLMIAAFKNTFGQDEDKQPDIVYYKKLKEAINKL